MTESRTQNSIRNLKYGVLNTLLITVLPFITRTVFIRVLGQNYLGIDAVFLNIINLIEIVNIGIGSAITYSVYQPIADGNVAKCRTFFRLYRNCYYAMGAIIFVVGVALTPFLDVLLKNKPDIPENIYLIYLIILVGISSGYFFADKQCVFNAHQKNYVISKARMTVVVAINIVEIVFLLLTKQYLVYLVISTCQNLTINLFVARKAKKEYPQLFGGKVDPLEKEEKRKIIKNTVALIFNRAGSLIINCTDSLIISSFVGVGAAGLYSNYFSLKNMVNTFTTTFTQSITASVGNLNASEQGENKERLNEVFSHAFFVNYLIHAFCSICLFCLVEPFIYIWIGQSYIMGLPIALIVSLNFYFIGVQKTAEQFKAACGLFWQDRFRVFIEAIINLIVSIVLVIKWGVLGVLAGTLISNLCVTFWVEPLIIHRHALKRTVLPYYIKNVLYFVIVAALALGIWKLDSLIFGEFGNLLQFVLRALFTAAASAVSLGLLFIGNPYFKKTVTIAVGLLHKRKKQGT